MIDRTKLRTRPPPRLRRHSSHHLGGGSGGQGGGEPIVAGPKVLAALVALILGIIWTVGVLFFSLNVTVPGDSSGGMSRRRAGGHSSSLDNLPNINLWPDDEINQILNKHLADCLPSKCKLKSSSAVTQQKQKQQPIVITILRPPGVFGTVLETFTRDFIKNSKFDKSSRSSNGRSNVVVHAKSQSPPDPNDAALTDDTTTTAAGSTVTARKTKQQNQSQQEYIVHAITLPLLLQAADLALLTVSNVDGYPKERITWNDILDIIVLLVRWHCRISTRVSMMKNNYVVKLGLASTLSHPTKSEFDLAHLLDIDLNDIKYYNNINNNSDLDDDQDPHDQQKQKRDLGQQHPSWVVDRSHLSVMVLKRVDQATALLRQMHGFLPGDSTQDLQDAVDVLLQDEFRSSGGIGAADYYCPTQPLRSGGIAGLGLFRWHSRMIDIVDLLLDDNTELVCKDYPNIDYCREQQQQQ